MKSGAAGRRTLTRMSKAGEVVDSRAERLREWRDARARALRAYEAWCAATRSDRHERTCTSWTRSGWRSEQRRRLSAGGGAVSAQPVLPESSDRDDDGQDRLSYAPRHVRADVGIALRAAASAIEPPPGPDVGDPTGLRDEHLREWRDTANQVVNAYKAWCAANCRDRKELYISFLDALGREERAAHQVERDLRRALRCDLSRRDWAYPSVRRPDSGSPGVQLVHYATVHRSQLLASFLLFALGLAVLMVFAAGLYRIIRRAEGKDDWLAMASLTSVVGGAGIFGAGTALFLGSRVSPGHRSRGGAGAVGRRLAGLQLRRAGV